MKYTLLIILSIPIFAWGQKEKEVFVTLPVVDGKVIYSGVDNVDSASKDELYLRAKRYFAETYKSSQDVIQLDDKQNGEITGKAILKANWFHGKLMGNEIVDLYHTVSIFVKDGRYKYEIKDIVVSYSAGSGANIKNYKYPIENDINNKDKYWKRLINGVDQAVKLNIDQIMSAMNKKSESQKKDW